MSYARSLTLRGALLALPATLAPGWSGCSFPEYGVAEEPLAQAHCLNRIKDEGESDYDCGQACAACGTVNDTDARFCKNCGSGLGESK